jgi:hypothetical protein
MGMGMSLGFFMKGSPAGEEPGLGIFGALPPELDDGSAAGVGSRHAFTAM